MVWLADVMVRCAGGVPLLWPKVFVLVLFGVVVHLVVNFSCRSMRFTSSYGLGEIN